MLTSNFDSHHLNPPPMCFVVIRCWPSKRLFRPLAGDNFPHNGTTLIAWDHWVLWVLVVVKHPDRYPDQFLQELNSSPQSLAMQNHGSTTCSGSAKCVFNIDPRKTRFGSCWRGHGITFNLKPECRITLAFWLFLPILRITFGKGSKLRQGNLSA